MIETTNSNNNNNTGSSAPIDEPPLVEILPPQPTTLAYPKFGKRHIVALWTFMGFVIVFITRVSLNNAIVSMVNDTTSSTKHSENLPSNETNGICPYPALENSSNSDKLYEFNWDHNMQGLILSSFYYGYICTQILGGILAQIVGARLLFAIGIGGTGVLTLLNPIAARTSPYLLVALRVGAGLLQGLLLPGSHFLLPKWSPKQERSVLVSFPLTGPQFGIMFAAPLTAVLCEYGFDGGWPTPFYVFGGLSIVWCIGWLLVVRDSPAQHSTISEEERKYIEENSGAPTRPVPLGELPWKAFALSPAVWAIVAAQTCHGWNFDSQVIELSTYLKDVLHISASLNGLVTMIPFVVVWIVQIFAAFLSDFMLAKGMPTIYVRKGLYVFGLTTSAAVLVTVGYVGCGIVTVVTLFSVSIGLSAFGFTGYVVNHVDIAPQFAGLLMGIANTFAQLPGILSPLIVGKLTNETSTAATWEYVFYISAGVSIFGALMFATFGDAKVQKWAEVTADVERQAIIVNADDDDDEEERTQEAN